VVYVLDRVDVEATGLMLVAEIFNMAIEALCDRDERMGAIKDVAAAAAGVAIAVWELTLAYEGRRLAGALAARA
jgi:diacylglycerol kinase (ATP)